MHIKYPGHMTKMAAMPIYGKNHNYFYFCSVAVIFDSQVNDRCPWAASKGSSNYILFVLLSYRFQ